MYNLNLFHAQIVTRYGGSIRCIVSRKKIEKTENLKKLLEVEKNFLVENVELTYEEFCQQCKSIKKEPNRGAKKIKSKGLKIVAKSCPARAVVLLNFCETDSSLLNYVAEQPTSLKLDYFIPGTKLKIVSDDQLLRLYPDYILLLWHLNQPIIDKWKKRGLKSKFIIPLPEVKIV